MSGTGHSKSREVVREFPRWLSKLNQPADAKLRSICFPYAGAGTSVFRKWPAQLPDSMEWWTVSLPGRGTRFLEAPAHDIGAIADAVSEELAQFSEKPYVMFGHSMGALLAFEVTRRLRDRGKELPLCLFVSGNRAPQLQHTTPRIENPATSDLREVLMRLNGTDATVMENPELMELLLPALRADLTVCQNYRYVEADRLACPIVAFAGQDDEEAPASLMQGWEQQAAGGFRLLVLPGDHFFFQADPERFLQKFSRLVGEAQISADDVAGIPGGEM